MKKIKLTQGKFAIIDDSDFEWLSQWKWHYAHGYAGRWKYNRTKKQYIYMHRLILKFPKSGIDHKNRNGLDNRKINLRICNQSQNNINTLLRKDNKTGYKGICYLKSRKKWFVQVHTNGKRIYAGYFKDIEDAVNIYNKLIKKYYGEFARVNVI